ncbi:MAG: hypothetical protein ABXS91_00005 [Sulfurimonas sp.]
MKSLRGSKKGLFAITSLVLLGFPTGSVADKPQKQIEIVENADDICYGAAIEQELVYPNVKRTVPILNQGTGYLTDVALIDATNGKLDDAQFYEFDCGIDDISRLDSGECVYRKEDEPVGDFRGIEFDWLNSTTTFHGTMLYDMPDYDPYESHSTYVTHIVNLEDLSGIEIYATYMKDNKLHRGRIQSCDTSSDLPFQNEYTCGTFPSVLTSYEHMSLMKNPVFNSCTISYPENQYTPGHNLRPTCYTDLTATELCEDVDEIEENGNCNFVPPPTNRYDHDFIETTNIDYTPEKNNIELTQLEYGGYMFNGNNQVIHLNPSKTYSNSEKNVMLLGDVSLTANNQKLILEAGDYYFRSLEIQKNSLQIEPRGNVRIFIRDDLVYAGNNAASTDPTASLFFYVGGDMDFTSGGGGTGSLSAFFYVEGDVEIKSSSNSSEIYGGITAEGRIDVTGNNINFKYNADGADQFGLGECAMCYEPPRGPNGINFFHILSFCTPITPCDLYVPVRNISPIPLDAVEVTEAHKSLADFAWGTNYEVVDKEETPVPGTSASKNPSLYLDLPMGFEAGLKNGYITYDIGDNYQTYAPDETYYQLHKEINFSMDLLDFSRLVYFGKYRDDVNRHYNVQLDLCQDVEIPPTYETGPFDAWDTFRGDTDNDDKFDDKNISTKIAGKEFSLTIANLDAELTGLEAKSISSTVTYGLYDGDEPIEETFDTFDIQNTLDITKTYTDVSVASRNVHVGFVFCSEFDGTTYTLLESAECSGDIINCKDTDENPRWRRCYSSDEFAIRPKEFLFTPPSGEDIELLTSGSTHRFTVVANKEDNTATDGYDPVYVSPDDQEDGNLTLTQRLIFNNTNGTVDTNNTLHGTLSFSNNNFEFVNGISRDRDDNTQTEVVGITFTDVGKVNIILEDRQWASVDSDDTPEGCHGGTFTNVQGALLDIPDGAYICGEQNATFIPAYFDVTGITLRNHNNEGNFTYLSNDPTMSAHVGATITARNSQGAITQNFREGALFYENPVSVHLNVTDWNASLQNRHPLDNDVDSRDIQNPTLLGFGGTDDSNGTHTISSASQSLLFNYQRNNNQPVNPFDVPGSDINISVASSYKNNTKTVTGSGVGSAASNVTFYFGRTKASKEFYEDITGDSVDTPVAVYVYCNTQETSYAWCDDHRIDTVFGQTSIPHWWLNTAHKNSLDGSVTLNATTPLEGNGTPKLENTGSGEVTTLLINAQQGIDNNITVIGHSTKIQRPMTIGINLDTSPSTDTAPWLIYNRDDPYNPPSPFYKVRFINTAGWTGVGKTGFVLQSNASNRKNKRLDW